MPPLTDADVIGLWEEGRGRDAVSRALLFLGTALPTLDDEARAAMSVPERDRALLLFRGASGRKLPAQTACPNCGEELEFEVDIDSVPDAPTQVDFAIADGTRFRLPTSADLLAVAKVTDIAGACRDLARRCCLDRGAALADTTIEEAGARMWEIHSAAAVGLRLACLACGHAWSDRLDIVAYLWREIEERAADLLDQVHWLASRYGWSEAAILAMAPSRRAAYLERCGA